MFKTFRLGNREWNQMGFIEGPQGYIVTESDFCHRIRRLDESIELDVDETLRAFTLADIRAIAEPASVADFGHYWGIKDRVAGNYHGLLASIREIGADATQMPEWGA